jgi:hypothetical protein
MTAHSSLMEEISQHPTVADRELSKKQPIFRSQEASCITFGEELASPIFSASHDMPSSDRSHHLRWGQERSQDTMSPATCLKGKKHKYIVPLHDQSLLYCPYFFSKSSLHLTRTLKSTFSLLLEEKQGWILLKLTMLRILRTSVTTVGGLWTHPMGPCGKKKELPRFHISGNDHVN